MSRFKEEVHTRAGQPDAAEQLLTLNEAMDKLAQLDPRAAQLVNLYFFAGLNQKLTAE